MFYCKAADMHQKGPVQWLKEQGAFDDRSLQVPKTTAWRMKAGKESNTKGYVCQQCGQPKLKEYGHSYQRGVGHFCALYECKSVELWLAEKRLQQ